jgi:phosphoribosylformylglycinamidine (FGAM) synthase PurS component
VKSLVIVRNRKQYPDPEATGVMALVLELGVQPDAVQTAQLYLLDGELSLADVKRLAKELLADPVTQEFSVEVQGNGTGKDFAKAAPGIRVDVWLKPQVADPVAPSVERGARDLGLTLLARCGHRYELKGGIDVSTAQRVAWRALANPVLHQCEFGAL